MWAINSLSSVVGSALALILAMTWGFPQALLAGATVYAGVALPFLWKRSPLQSSRLHQTKARRSLAGAAICTMIGILIALTFWSSFTGEFPFTIALPSSTQAVIIHPGLATSTIEAKTTFHLPSTQEGSSVGLLPPGST